MPEPQIIDRSAQQTHAWLRELTVELGQNDQRAALRVLRAVLHAIRDRLPVDESAHLAAQLPTLLRGLYYEGWRPSATRAPYHDVDSMLSRVADEAGLAGETEASLAVTSVATLLRRHVSAGELDQVIALFPTGIRPLLTGERVDGVSASVGTTGLGPGSETRQAGQAGRSVGSR